MLGWLKDALHKRAVRPPESGQGGDGASGSGGKGGMGGWFGRAKEKVKRWKNRTPVQQEANKAAQKRYRERKKGQVAELQAQADSLAAQARSLLRPLPVPPCIHVAIIRIILSCCPAGSRVLQSPIDRCQRPFIPEVRAHAI